MDRGAWKATVNGVTESHMIEQLTLWYKLKSFLVLFMKHPVGY